MLPQKIRETRRKTRRRGVTFSHKVNEATEAYGMDERDRVVIQALMGLSATAAPLISSNLAARAKAAILLERALSRHRKSRPKPARNYYFGTLIDDSGNTSDRAPMVSIKDIRDKAYRAIKAAGLSAVGVIEVHPLMNYPGEGQGRTLLWHVHFIAWSDQPIDIAQVVQSDGLQRSWRCQLGAEPVHIKEIGRTKEDLAEVAHYVLKAPHAAKNRKERSDKPGTFRLFDTLKGYRPEFALRVLEGLSQIKFVDVMFGVGEGKSIRQSVRKDLMDWHRNRDVPITVTADFDIWLFWLKLRQSKGSKNFLPYRITGVSRDRTATPRRSNKQSMPSVPRSPLPSKADRQAREKIRKERIARRPPALHLRLIR